MSEVDAEVAPGYTQQRSFWELIATVWVPEMRPWPSDQGFRGRACRFMCCILYRLSLLWPGWRSRVGAQNGTVSVRDPHPYA